MSGKRKNKQGGRRMNGSSLNNEVVLRSNQPPRSPQRVYVRRQELSGIPFQLTTSAGGAITSVTAVSTALFNTVTASPFTAFDLVCYHEWGVDMIPTQSASGTTYAYWDADDTTVPTFSISDRKDAVLLSNAASALSNPKGYRIRWQPTGPTYVDWLNTATAVPYVAGFKVYTDSANLGSAASANVLWTIRPYCIASFAGLA